MDTSLRVTTSQITNHFLFQNKRSDSGAMERKLNEFRILWDQGDHQDPLFLSTHNLNFLKEKIQKKSDINKVLTVYSVFSQYYPYPLLVALTLSAL